MTQFENVFLVMMIAVPDRIDLWRSVTSKDDNGLGLPKILPAPKIFLVIKF